MPEPLLEASRIRRRFGDFRVLAGITLTVHQGEFVVILGPSGCGKTTLLNILAGFDRGFGQGGTVRLAGHKLRGPSEDIGVIFQEGSLFPWLTVSQNVLFGSRMRALDDREQATVLARYLQQFGLEEIANKYPDQISGGQHQRAAVARALVNRPSLLLADEPFRALDSRTRLSSQIFLRQELRQRDQTLCLITHDIDEALLLGDRLIILSERPTRVLEEFEVDLGRERDTTTVVSKSFRKTKAKFVEFCLEHKLPLFPPRQVTALVAAERDPGLAPPAAAAADETEAPADASDELAP